jgi:hypothetical protein
MKLRKNISNVGRCYPKKEKRPIISSLAVAERNRNKGFKKGARFLKIFHNQSKKKIIQPNR